VTPASCDINAPGAISPDRFHELPWAGTAASSMLGCQEYRGGQYFKSFTRLCREEAVGCQPVIVTANSDSPFAESYQDFDGSAPNITEIDEVHVPADQIAFAVNSRANRCSAADIGCTRLGLATVDRFGTATFDSRFYKLLPDDIENRLCQQEQNLCSAYAPEDGSGTVYFRDPQDRICQWRNSVPTSGGQVATWAIVDSNVLCETETGQPQVPLCDRFADNSAQYLPDRGTSQPLTRCSLTGASCNTDAECPLGELCVLPVGCYSKVCNEEDAGCREYRDPQDPPRCDERCTLEFDSSGAPVRYYAAPGCLTASAELNYNVCSFNQAQPCTSDAECSASGVTAGRCIANPLYRPGCRTYYYQTVEFCGTGEINPLQGCTPFFAPAEGEPTIISNCQPGCSLLQECSGSGTPCNSNFECGGGATCQPVRLNEDCQRDPAGKQGCSLN
jgi:hypothetical protein